MPLASIDNATVLSPDTERKLLRDFGARAFHLGLRYWRDGRIRQLVDEGTSLFAQVLGSNREVYNVVVYPELQSVIGDCTCPVGYNCKHAAAVAISHFMQERPGRIAWSSRDANLSLWLADLTSLAQRRHSPEHLIYIVGSPSAHQIDIQAYKVRRLKSGKLGTPKPYNGNGSTAARFLVPDDERILPALQHYRGGAFQAERTTILPTLLHQLALTRRAYSGSREGPQLQLGSTVNGAFEWHMDEAGQQKLGLRVEGMDDAVVVPSAPPWYIDPHDGRTGAVETAVPQRLAAKLLSGPTVDIREAGKIVEPLRQIGLDIPLPRQIQGAPAHDIAPVPQLYLTVLSARPALFSVEQSAGHGAPMAQLTFDYDGISTSPSGRHTTLIQRKGDVIREIARDSAAEKAAIAALEELGAVVVVAPQSTFVDLHDADGWLDFLHTGVPKLRAQGWRISIDPDFPFRIVDADAWYADLDDAGNNAWFDLEIGVEIEGERHPLLPLLIQLLRRFPQAMDPRQLEQASDEEATFTLGLGDGRYLPVPAKRFASILRTLTELYDAKLSPETERLRLSRLRATTLGELDTQGTAWHWQGNAEIREAGRALLALGETHCAPQPASLNAELRRYQREGVGWLQCLADLRLGGILADDMGLGKTIQILTHLLLLKESGQVTKPSLVVMPTSLLFNWEREAQRFAPSLKVLRLHGPKRGELAEEVTKSDLVLTTYALVHRDIETLSAQRFHLCVLDEAQAVKNARSHAAQAVRRISAEQRLCLTGTPLENHLGELWAQFDFLLPGLLGDSAQFNRLFRRPIEREDDGERRAALRRRIAPFVMRRTKQAVATELPDKTELQRYAELRGSQRDLYETVRTAMHKRVRREVQKKGLARSHIIVLDALLKLRQICCDPRLLKMEAARKAKGSAKLDLLMELLPGLIDDGRRVLLFSQFTSMLALIEQALARTSIAHVQLTGQTRDRETPIRRFQSGEVPLFLISLKAGGTGLNLTAADTVIHYDPWWNPAVMRQATDRAHRIGQTQSVFVYHLISKDTVEEKMIALQQRKTALGDAMLGGAEGHTPAFDMDDVEALFAPIT